MRKTFEFNVKGHSVKITNSWFSGAKLYVDGDLRDTDRTFLALQSKPLLSANLGEAGILEINPLSKAITVEMDAFLIKDGQKQPVYSSHKRLSLTQKRLAQ
ncbi:hypothetical protein [Paraferrimonas sp. SM1919]|uniref:hypothetical protein n=1 Tax=Paraferrimonas sp. SM1919 TaxID=2662263 RepID=UPI0013D43D2E|nr:hypothetical protein [Paraferrimonas sp. SM1919]